MYIFLYIFGSLQWKELYMILVYFNIMPLLPYFSFLVFENLRFYGKNFVNNTFTRHD
jgi:hypothetical protein